MLLIHQHYCFYVIGQGLKQLLFQLFVFLTCIILIVAIEWIILSSASLFCCKIPSFSSRDSIFPCRASVNFCSKYEMACNVKRFGLKLDLTPQPANKSRCSSLNHHQEHPPPPTHINHQHRPQISPGPNQIGLILIYNIWEQNAEKPRNKEINYRLFNCWLAKLFQS